MLKQLIFDFLANSEQSWPVYGGGDLDRRTKLTSSENLRCIRRLAFEKQPPSQPDTDAPTGETGWSWGYAQRGHSVEAWAVDMLENELLHHGHTLSYHGGGQVSFVWGDLSGTPDGLIAWKDGSYTLVEIKSIDPRKNTRDIEKAPVAQHYAQVQQNMFLIEANTGIKCKNAAVLYINASDFSQMIEHIVPYDNGKLADDMAKKAEWLFSSSITDLPPEGMQKRNGDCDTCMFREDCNAVQGTVTTKRTTPVMPTFANRTVAGLLRRYADAKETGDATAKVLDTLKQEIFDYATERGVSVIESAELIAKVTEVAGRKTLDTKAYVAATGVDPDPYYKTGRPSLRLSVEAK